MMAACYQVPNGRMTKLRSAVTRLANRAAKLGLEKVALVEHRAADRIVELGRGKRYALPCTWVELTGPSPVVSGFEFLARVEHTTAGNLVSRVDDGSTDLASFRSAKADCDHCKQSRARIDTFVLRAPGGELKQIGRNCLADYLRSADVEIAIGILRLVEEISDASNGSDPDEDGGCCGGWTAISTPAEFVAASVAAVRLHGWVSSKAASDERLATRVRAGFICGPRPKGDDNGDRWLAEQPTDEDKARGAAIVEWLKASTDASDYMHNLRVAVALQATTHRTEGLLASTVVAYEKHVEGIERARAAGKVPSQHFGEVGKRYELAGTVERVHFVDGSYGVSTLVVFTDADGRRFKWFASGSKDGFEVGKTVAIKGTVKKHEEYKGSKETVLTRCTVAA